MQCNEIGFSNHHIAFWFGVSVRRRDNVLNSTVAELHGLKRSKFILYGGVSAEQFKHLLCMKTIVCLVICETAAKITRLLNNACNLLHLWVSAVSLAGSCKIAL